MKVWLYYRLSRDEDEELNSLNNQRKIIYNFAVSNGHEVVGESFDDNVSGMHFNREGIDKIYEVVEAGKIEAIIVKDLSRLGRHRTQTALFIDYLKEIVEAYRIPVFEVSLQRRTSIPSTRTTISSSASRGWSTTSMPATAAAGSAPDIDRSKRKVS